MIFLILPTLCPPNKEDLYKTSYLCIQIAAIMKIYNIRMLSSLIFVIVTVIFYICIDYSFKDVKNELIEEAESLFHSAIQQDKALRGKGFINNFRFKKEMTCSSLDSITISTEQEVEKLEKTATKELTYEEKKDITDQMYLLKKNPIQVINLDSLFKAMLYKNEVPVETAVVYTINEKSEYSNLDSMFYKNATPLNSVSIGSLINLQGYVKFDNVFIFNKIQHVWTFVLLWFGLALIILIYNFLKWREWRIFSILYVKPIGESKFELSLPETKHILISGSTSDYMRIRDDLYFNYKKGEIKYKNTIIRLSRKSVFLLKYLLEGEDWFQAYESIKKTVWCNESTSNDAVRNAVNRLNKEIENISGFHIEKIPMKGLRIICEVNEFVIL